MFVATKGPVAGVPKNGTRLESEPQLSGLKIIDVINLNAKRYRDMSKSVKKIRAGSKALKMNTANAGKWATWLL
jgi:hypothetical protein